MLVITYEQGLAQLGLTASPSAQARASPQVKEAERERVRERERERERQRVQMERERENLRISRAQSDDSASVYDQEMFYSPPQLDEADGRPGIKRAETFPVRADRSTFDGPRSALLPSYYQPAGDRRGSDRGGRI